MREPSVKGIMFSSAVDRVRDLIDTGQLRQDEVACALEAQDLEYLKDPIMPTLWYPIGVCSRYLELLWEIDGQRHADYLAERGATAAERIFSDGIYANVMKTAEKWGANQTARALINIAAQFYNFMRWELVGNFHDDEYAVEVHDAAEWPDVLRFAGEAFIEVLHSRASDRSLSVVSERPTPDRVIYKVSAQR